MQVSNIKDIKLLKKMLEAAISHFRRETTIDIVGNLEAKDLWKSSELFMDIIAIRDRILELGGTYEMEETKGKVK